MLKTTILLLLTSTLFLTQADAQTYKQQFSTLLSGRDTAGQRQLLEKWQKTDSNDAELYVAYFNYYVNRCRQEIIVLGNNPKGETVLQINDSSEKEPAAYLYGDVQYNPVLLAKGFEYADKGITLHPSRLDIRLGKTYIYGEVGDWKNFTAEIIKTIDYSVKIDNKWIWANDKPLENPKEFMLSSIQSYQIQLYETNTDSLLNDMKQIAETILKYYPDHVESLSNLSIIYMIRKEYDSALTVLLKAEKLAPKDYIVLSNIAEAYKRKGDTSNAIKYYELTSKYGDAEIKQFAQEQIAQLKKK